jgi:vacuolar-type H+-ATPase subunit I/STV1
MRRYQENINQKKPITFGIFSIVMYLLLDTNILVGFLTDPHERYLIDRLESLLQLEEFQLLVPVTLKNEWQDKRKQELQRIRKNFSEVKQRLSNDSSIDSQLQDELRIVNERADRIEAFLNNGISIELSDAVKIRTSDRKMNNLPPFRSVRSYNDGLIFFSAIEYLKQINEKEYCFVTKDRDFCNPNLKDQFEPDLMEKDLEVFFSLSLEKMIRILVSMGKIKDEQNVTNAEQGITIEVVRRKKMNFLDYLYENDTASYILQD